MNIFEFLKSTPALYKMVILSRAYQQECKARKELNYYRKIAEQRGIAVPAGETLISLLKRRLKGRGISPTQKEKGSLHIFLVFGINNWEAVLPLALSPFGHVTTFSWQTGGFFDRYNKWLKWRNDLNADILDTFKKAHSEQPVDIMVGYLSDFNTTKETLIEIGKNGVTIFNMCWDDKLYFNASNVKGQPRSLKGIVSAVDLNLTNAPDSCIKYLIEGGLSMFWAEAAHPDIYKPYDLPFEFDVSFIGSKSVHREKLVNHLRKMGIKVATFGKGWRNGLLPEDEMVKLFSRSRISLGYAGVGYSDKLMCLKGRDFEVPMSGGLYLTQDNPELALVYKVGREIVTYKDENDCVRKIRWLLDNPEHAEKIRKAGQERTLKEHTWEKRFLDIFMLTGVLRN